MHARIFLVAVLAPLIACFTCVTDKDIKSEGPQGWSPDQRLSWYTAPQGSRLLPYAWLQALENRDSATAFLDPANIARYRYLPSQPDAAKRTNGCLYDPSLPVGFTVECVSDEKFGITKLRWKAGQAETEPWVGLNCSACHTAVLEYRNKSVWVDGGPAMADFQSFIEELNGSLKATVGDRARFSRFANKVLGPQPAPGDPEKLRAALAQLVDWNDKLDYLNADSSTRYGFGRLDAIGHIFNKVALIAMPDDVSNQVSNPSDAPVSYPFLWNITQLNKVEWDGVVPNSPISGPGGDFDAGALARNTGEVIGVFGDVTVASSPGLDGYVTSVNVTNLVKIEEQLRTLRPPKWPQEFPAIDQPLAKIGEGLFKSQHCDSCHAIPTTQFSVADKYNVQLSKVFSSTPEDRPVQTDLWMACNAVFDRANTGRFKGTPLNLVLGEPLQDNSDNLGLLQTAVVGTVLGQKQNVAVAAFEGVFGINRGLPGPNVSVSRLFAFDVEALSPKLQRKKHCMDAMMNGASSAAEVRYKGRPLQGIWATAPYLHNGSVPTLFDLLLPPSDRPPFFYTGSREFDPKNVGFVTAPSEQNSFRFDTVGVEGNSNGGHDYNNTGLTNDDRKALVEYMKTL